MDPLDWESSESHFFINPRLPDDQRITLGNPLTKLNHGEEPSVLLTTSGTESLKWVVLTKAALLESAKAVNEHIEASARDIWINALPHFHVGGLSIYARAFLTGSFVYRYDDRWNAAKWKKCVEDIRGTIASLVPTQVWDVVENQLPCPKSLRVLFVGGQRLPLELYERGRKLGWPLIPTYGMTECSSQVATATLDSPDLKLLPHVEVKLSPSGLLTLKSKALFKGYLKPDFEDPKVDGWFESQDKVHISDNILNPLGRLSDVIKIKGELINLYELEELLEKLKGRFSIPAETVIIPIEDARGGYTLHLFHSPYNVSGLIEQFNQSVIPEARIFAHTELNQLPRTAIGKIAKEIIKNQLR